MAAEELGSVKVGAATQNIREGAETLRLPTLQPVERWRITAYIAWVTTFTLVLIQPLFELMRQALQSELNSYIPIVPLVTGYLLYLRRGAFAVPYRSSVGGAIVVGVLGLTALAVAITMRDDLSANDHVGLLAATYVAAIGAGGFLFLGSRWMAAAGFPVAFLIFMVPLPDAAVHAIETASVLASADLSAFFFRLTGTPLLRDGTLFTLPGIVLRVAEECSGIHSSWVLFITSLVVSHLLLDSPWRRLILVVFVFPLAIVRNSFRILVIGLLCVHVGPHMIDSVIHRHGGPVFFALSLIPLFGLLAWLRRGERSPSPGES